MLWFLDVNETLVRTGEVPLALRRRELAELEQFRRLCARLARQRPWTLVLTTGNSFEYTRRIEEPLGLKNLPGLEVVIASENGLLARDLRHGDLWRAQTAPEYHRRVAEFLREAARGPQAVAYITQGNEVRTTLKPAANAFTPGELARLTELSEQVGLGEVARWYGHAFYFDLDPLQVLIDGQWTTDADKAYVVVRLATEHGGPCVALGDSASDLPLFAAVRAQGGRAFLVGNAPSDLAPDLSERLAGEFTGGVVELARRLLAERAVVFG